MKDVAEGKRECELRGSEAGPLVIRHEVDGPNSIILAFSFLPKFFSFLVSF